ncbi:MAG: MFS transporter [Alphaproteobacteria bacterium]|nr:MFS transporter [Alphaproteobacteria bacterium]MBU0798865.1 MFS transporter [Alphaproteobacteria bacterium]MBU0888715.1 MFS transporter [Alphaproteobacteria bacterium]MBU1813551.1 MFS transporter [Alphaproteobacteria bacterium]MBU2089472.1 MFS transporter [Alphaproteobacteria bacterium]
MTHSVASPRPSRRAVFSWCLFDWANNAYPTVITTFIFAAYFTRGVAETPEQGTFLWGQTTGLAGLAVALTGPILGAIADRAGARKPWIIWFSLLSIVASAGLWFVKPDAGDIPLALALVALGALGYEYATIFYNSMLPDLTTPGRVGRLSGWGWAAGYGGGLACLVVALFGLVQADPPPFGLDPDAAEPVRATALLVAGWYLVFMVPLLIWTPDRAASGLPLATATGQGLAELVRLLRDIRQHGPMVRFLLARMFYVDGLTTLFAFGGIYAAGTFGMSFAEIIQFGIAMNVTAGLGAFLFAWIDDWIGPKRTILITLVCLIGFGIPVLLVEDVTWFWILTLTLGLFVGPAQAAGRSLMTRLSPEGREAEMFGLFALSGKATAWAGPMLLGWVTLMFDSQRAGMATIIVFFVIGLVLLLPLKEPKAR